MRIRQTAQLRMQQEKEAAANFAYYQHEDDCRCDDCMLEREEAKMEKAMQETKDGTNA